MFRDEILKVCAEVGRSLDSNELNEFLGDKKTIDFDTFKKLVGLRVDGPTARPTNTTSGRDHQHLVHDMGCSVNNRCYCLPCDVANSGRNICLETTVSNYGPHRTSHIGEDLRMPSISRNRNMDSSLASQLTSIVPPGASSRFGQSFVHSDDRLDCDEVLELWEARWLGRQGSPLPGLISACLLLCS